MAGMHWLRQTLVRAEQHLIQLKSKDKEKHRYLEVCKTHPEANGLDVRSLLIQPVQRVLRYRLLLADLLARLRPLREAERVDRLHEGRHERRHPLRRHVHPVVELR